MLSCMIENRNNENATCDPKREIILVCVVGLSPAVITETVWAIAQEDPDSIPHRVVALTTVAGKTAIKATLFDNGGWFHLKNQLQASGLLTDDTLLKFGLSDSSIRLIPNTDGTDNLSDILSSEDSTSTADFMLESMRGLTETPDTALIVSVAGGRKTMSVLLHSVMCLLGRSWDRITHVLVSDPWDHVPGFLFPGCAGVFTCPNTRVALQSASAHVTLLDIPFVTLRYYFANRRVRAPGSYSKLVEELRCNLLNDYRELSLSLNLDTCDAVVNSTRIPLSPRELVFLLYFAERLQRGKSSLGGFESVTQESIHDCCRRHKKADDFSHWSHLILEKPWDAKEDPRKAASSIRQKLRSHGFESDDIDRLVPSRAHFALQIPIDCLTLQTTTDR